MRSDFFTQQIDYGKFCPEVILQVVMELTVDLDFRIQIKKPFEKTRKQERNDRRK
jgi:hypothetical protein